jgi:threonine dehydrogenase-like Zn-dependent dehydrogenase
VHQTSAIHYFCVKLTAYCTAGTDEIAMLWSLIRWLISGQFMGIVEKVGPDVKKFHPGDRVVVSCIIACGVCRCIGTCAAACWPATFGLQRAATSFACARVRGP